MRIVVQMLLYYFVVSIKKGVDKDDKFLIIFRL